MKKPTSCVKYHLHTKQKRVLLTSSNLKKLERHAKPGDMITMSLI